MARISNLYPDIAEIKKTAGKKAFVQLTDFDKAFRILLTGQGKVIDDPCFYSYADKRIAYMYHLNREGNAEAYQLAINELKKFRPKLRYSQLDRSLMMKFIEFKKSEKKKDSDERKVKNGSIRTYIAEIRAIYNKCSIEYNLPDNTPFKGVFTDLPIRKRRAKNVYIDHEAIDKVKKSNLKQISYQRSLDLSLLQFYLGGQYLIDVYYLKWSQIHKKRVYFERIKLGEKKVEFDVKLFPEAEELINKYCTSQKDGYVFPWDKDRSRYKTFRDNHRRNVKKGLEILEIQTLPKNEPFNSRSPRHTFQTLGKFKFIDPDIIREIVGHERDDVDTVYKDKYPENVRDDAHKRIIYNLD
ncbi:phage integrase SAM-like domain-containing protein [Aquimarina algiphila]|uniref:phage integrase SAM-like domain-containing protein n=1 Tax=Aquimarina algiphila TaxID=2047982 RepID=UPI001430BA46|nr:phage integrase SAM-like domain-containing protein [Aquimarina algiphila]